MKVCELEGAELDAAVAMCEGYRFGKPWPQTTVGYILYPLAIPGQETLGSVTMCPDGEWSANIKRYSRDWAIGGPIIERERIELDYNYAPGGWSPGSPWIGMIRTDNGWDSIRIAGQTALISAMRAYVTSKFGDEVDKTRRASDHAVQFAFADHRDVDGARAIVFAGLG